GILGGSGVADVHAFPGFRSNVGGDSGRDPEFHSGAIFWNLSSGASVTARPGGCLEVRLMPIMTLAQARENFFAAMETLRSSKVRSALTVLGIVIGVSSVISMAAIIQGLNKFVQDRVQALGSPTYFISRFPPGTDPSRWPESIRVRKYFEYNYAGFIRDAAPDVQALTTIGTRGLFFGPGVDIFAVIPLSCFKKEYPEAKELIMAFTVPENVNVETAQGEVIQAMRRLRHIPAGKENDFELSSPDFISNLWNQLTG